MKKRIQTLIIMLTLCFAAGTLKAQAPEGINYQATLRNAAGSLLINQAVGIKISIIESSPTGAVVYAETHSQTSSPYGVIALVIGSGTAVSGQFSDIDWAGDLHYIKLEVDPAGGTSYTDMGTSQIVSVPYALEAAHASAPWVQKNDSTLYFMDAVDNALIGINTLAPSAMLHVNSLLKPMDASSNWAPLKITENTSTTRIGGGKIEGTTSLKINSLTASNVTMVEGGGGVRIGAGGSYIKNVVKLTGNTNTFTPPIISPTAIAYPAGFTKANTIILDFQIERQSATNYYISHDPDITISITDNDIRLSYPSDAIYSNKPYKLTLMRID